MDRLAWLRSLGRPVQFAVWSGSGYLNRWGRDPHGGWWALVLWQERAVRRPWGEAIDVLCAAWIPADTVQRFTGPDYASVPRTRLGNDPERWPCPPSRLTRRTEGVYFGRLPAAPGDLPVVLPPPVGMNWATGRQRRRRLFEQAGW